MEKQTLVKEICPTTTQEWVKNGAVLVDVREKEEVAELAYDVPNIINIPLSEFEERFNEVPKDKKVVLVCKDGVKSLRAAGFLVNHGYTNVVNMQHGIVRWAQKEFPTKGDALFVLGNTQGSGCCDISDRPQSGFTPKEEKVNTNDSGSSDGIKPYCC